MKQIITGRSGYGKTAYITERIKEDLKAGYENIIVIVPDQFTFETERELIKETGNGLFTIRVLSFRRLITVLQQELGTGGCTILDDVNKAMFVSKLLYDYDNELQVYKGAYRTPGFGFDMAKAITECKQFGAQPQDLEDLGLKGRTGAKLADITAIYKAYTDFKDKFKDNEDIINIITERIAYSRLLKGARVYIDHFDVFTYQGYNIIEAMAKVCSSLCVCLCSDGSKKGLFTLTTDTMEKLKERVPDFEILHLDKPIAEGAISHLERNLFDGKGEVMTDGKNNVELFSFATALEEIDHAAAKIIELKNQGCRYSDISLMVGDIEEYGSAVEQCFLDCGIPCFRDRKIPLMSGRIARFVICSLKACLSLEQSHYIGMLKQGIFFDNREDIQKYENYILKYGIKRTLTPIKDDEDMERLRKQVALDKLKKPLSKATTVTEMAKATMDYLDSFYIACKHKPEEAEDKDIVIDEEDERNLEIELQSYKKVIEILERMELIFGDTEIEQSLFVTILETGFCAVTLGVIPDKRDCVVIGDISRTKIQRARCLLVLGISDGVIPKITQKTGLINDYDSAAINKHIKIGRDSFDLNNLEQLLTYKMFSKPTDYLCLSHSDRGIYGNERTNKMLIPKVQKLLGDIPVYSNVPFNEEMELRILRSKSLALKSLFAKVYGGEDDYITRGLYYYFEKEKGALFTPKNYDLSISNKQAEEVYGKTAISASRIETYFKCAFMQFMRYGLRPRRRELYKINKLDTGSLLHSIIESFSKETIEKSNSYNNTKELYEVLKQEITGGKMVERLVKEQFAKDDLSIYEDDNIGKIMAKRLADISKSALLGVVEELKDSDFVMTYSEVDLKKLGGYKLGDMNLEGRIDRVDLKDEGIRIVDYKQGGSALDYTSVYGGIKLQLLIYMEAVMEHYRREQEAKRMPQALAYYKLNTEYKNADNLSKLMSAVPPSRTSTITVGEGNKARVIKADEMDKLIGFGMYKAKKAAESIYNGDIAIKPYFIAGRQNDNGCAYCEYMDICKNGDMENRRIIKAAELEDIINDKME